jgi:hypothetical protein
MGSMMCSLDLGLEMRFEAEALFLRHTNARDYSSVRKCAVGSELAVRVITAEVELTA